MCLSYLFSCSAIAVNNSWISAVGNSTVGKYIRIILQKLHLSWLSIFITDRIIKSIASSNNVTKRAHTIVTLIFNNLSSFEGLGLLLSLSKPSGDIQNISFKTNDTNIQQTERIFKYKFSSEFDFDKILKYEVETWRSYVGEIIKDAENLMKQNGGNFERKLWFAHCFTQEEICSRYSEEKYSLKEFLKTKNEELGKKEEKTEIFNDENLDDDSIHDLDFIVIYHDDTAKKCVYIFQIEIERLTSKGRVSGENDHWTHVHYDTTKCMLRKFNHENVDYVCVVEDYIETGTVLPWSVLIEQQN